MLPSPARHRQPLRLLSHVFPFLGKSDSYGEASRRSGEGAQRTVCLYNLLGLYFPLNFRAQTASEVGFKPPTKRFVKLARLPQVPSKFEKWRANPRFYVLRANTHCR